MGGSYSGFEGLPRAPPPRAPEWPIRPDLRLPRKVFAGIVTVISDYSRQYVLLGVSVANHPPEVFPHKKAGLVRSPDVARAGDPHDYQ